MNSTIQILPAKPATPGRAATALVDQPGDIAAQVRDESWQRPHLFLHRYQGKLSADLRYLGGTMSGVDLIGYFLLALAFPGEFRGVAVVLWAPEGYAATLDMPATEARDLMLAQQTLAAADAHRLSRAA